MSARAAEHRFRIARIMTDERFNLRGKRIQVWFYILTAELAAGTQFLVANGSGQLYAVVTEDGQTKVHALPRSGRGGDGWWSHVNATYGLGEREDWSKFMYDALRPYVLKHGTRVEVRRFAAYDTTRQIVYLSAYNGRMYRVDGEDITDTTIGEDGVFFVDDDPGRPTESDVDLGAHGMLFDRLINGVNFQPRGLGGITAEQQRKALIVWMFALAFPDYMPDKPILILEGRFGSGKSSVVTFMQLVLCGEENPTIVQRNKEDDFGAVLQRSPICLLDNVDNYIDWIPDAIAAYTTLGRWNKRKLFTDDEIVTIKPQAFLAVATRNPASFRREDVADRCVILRLERRPLFLNLRELKLQILTERPQLLGEYLHYVSKIVVEMRRTPSGRQEQYRMASFAGFGRIVGKVLGWPDEEVDGLMRALQGERDAFINEEDPLCDLLSAWIAYKPKNGPANIGRLMTASQLHSELTTFAQITSRTWNDSMRTLTQKMKSGSVERMFRVEQSQTAGQISFKIWRHSDAQLTLVDEIPLPEAE